MMMKCLFAMIFIMICAAIGAGYHISALQSELKQAKYQLETMEKARKLAQETEIKARAARQVENEKARERERLMQNVLNDNCDWSRIVVPDDVIWMLQYGEAGNSGICASGNTP